MTWWLFIIPFISAFVGWTVNLVFLKMLFHPNEPKNIAGIRLHGIIPKRQGQFAEKLSKYVSEEMFSANEFVEKISDPSQLKKIMPVVESHIDDFFNQKLNDAFPIISRFIGDKTRSQLKAYFMKELEEIFPDLIKNYAGNLLTEIDIGKLAAEKLSNFPPEKLEFVFQQSLSHEIRLIKLAGAVTGFIAGSIQVIVSLFWQN